MAYIERYKQAFGLLSKTYKKYRGSYNEKLYALIFSLMRSKGREISILDLGCGVGNSTEPLLQMAKKIKQPVSIIGCDIDERMLREARLSAKKNKLPIVYVAGAAEKLPFERGQFDVVVSGASFHWFATKKAMTGVQRVLKENGMYIVFWVQNVEGKNTVIGQELYKKYKWQGIPRHLRDPKHVREIFIKNGFTKVKAVAVPYVEKRTMAETLGLIQTNSSYALLSSADKKVFMREMKKAYVTVLGTKSDTLTQVINVCYGIKP